MENQNLNDPSKDSLLTNDVNLSNQNELLNEHVYKEETSAEMVGDPPAQTGENYTNTHDDHYHDQENRHEEVQNMYGWIAIALSAISFFLIPILFAAAGIIVGFIARKREAPILGNTAIVIGILSILIRLFILPLI